MVESLDLRPCGHNTHAFGSTSLRFGEIQTGADEDLLNGWWAKPVIHRILPTLPLLGSYCCYKSAFHR